MCTSPLPFHHSGASDLDFLQKKLVQKKEVEAYWLVHMCSLSSCSLHSCSCSKIFVCERLCECLCAMQKQQRIDERCENQGFYPSLKPRLRLPGNSRSC